MIYTRLYVGGVTLDHASACCVLLGGHFTDTDMRMVRLPEPMTADRVRGALGCLWRGVALRGKKEAK